MFRVLATVVGVRRPRTIATRPVRPSARGPRGPQTRPRTRRRDPSRSRTPAPPAPCQRQDASSDMHGDAAEISSTEFDLTRVQPRSNLDARGRESDADGLCTAIARAGPSNTAMNPSPVVFTSRPRNRSSCSRTIRLCSSRIARHRASPTDAARSVEPTMSVKRIVARRGPALGPGERP